MTQWCYKTCIDGTIKTSAQQLELMQCSEALALWHGARHLEALRAAASLEEEGKLGLWGASSSRYSLTLPQFSLLPPSTESGWNVLNTQYSLGTDE